MTLPPTQYQSIEDYTSGAIYAIDKHPPKCATANPEVGRLERGRQKKECLTRFTSERSNQETSRLLSEIHRVIAAAGDTVSYRRMH